MKITESKVESCIVEKQFYVFPGTTTTVCCLTLHTGFTTIGHSACMDPLEFNEDLGKELAYKKAFSKAWGIVTAGVMELHTSGIAVDIEPTPGTNEEESE